MSRELSKELFGGEPILGSEIGKSPSMSASSRSDSSRSEVRWREIALEMQKLKRQILEANSKIDSTNNRVDVLTKGTKRGFERLQNGIQMLEKTIRSHVQDLASQVSLVKGRMTERKAVEAKVQELVDRHNQVVQNFESRLSQFQKVTSEQEMKLMGYKSALEEMQRRLGR